MLDNLTKPKSLIKNQLIKSYREQILDSIDTEADMERAIFESTEFEKSKNWKILLALHLVSSSSNIAELRKIDDKVETVTRNLQWFEVHAEHFYPILIAVLTNKLPSDFRLQVSRNMPQWKWEISKLLHEFEKELLSRERINILNSDNLNPAPTLFPGCTLHLKAQKGQPKTNQILCTHCKQKSRKQ